LKSPLFKRKASPFQKKMVSKLSQRSFFSKESRFNSLFQTVLISKAIYEVVEKQVFIQKGYTLCF
jgi:hypothetical protein